ncbi:MAG: AraC family transcriptional regulator [Gammaproteobacteria bacterium]|nr:AraC family transcriptional regulator [Gammaproteobacteria bacterium]
MKLQIRNMVCDRCTLVIRNTLEEMGVQPVLVRLGEVDLGDQLLDEAQLVSFREKIERLGFELIGDRKSQLIESIKKYIIVLVQEPGDVARVRISDYLSEKLFHDYAYLSNLFSSVEGVTIESFFIHQKIEKVKELLVYDELTLTEIAYRLGYSSVAHLSRQFKKVTGQTPSEFKRLRDSSLRKPLDKV